MIILFITFAMFNICEQLKIMNKISKNTTKMPNNKIKICNTPIKFPVFTKQTSENGIVETGRAPSLRWIRQ
jgi:hypothetical protein